MKYRGFKTEATLGIIYLIFGLVILFLIVLFPNIFMHGRTELTTAEGIGVLVLCVLGILWVVFLVIHAKSKRGQEFYRELVLRDMDKQMNKQNYHL